MNEEDRKAAIEKLRVKYAVPGQPTGDDYDPHDFRILVRGINYCETMSHIVKAVLGTGFLAMANGFKNSGLLFGIILTFLIGFLSTHGMLLYSKSRYTLCKRMKIPFISYPDGLKAATLIGPHCMLWMANACPVFVDVTIVAFQIGVLAVYIVFVSNSLQQLIEPALEEPMRPGMYTLMLILPLFLLLLVPDLKYLALMSTFSNVLIFSAFGLIIYYTLLEFPSTIEGKEVMGEFSQLPLFAGTVFFALAAIGVIATVEANMAKPKQFSDTFGVVNVAMTMLIIIHALIGFAGYWRFGADIQPSISYNIAETYGDVPAKILVGFCGAAVFISCSLNAFPTFDILWNNYLKQHFKNENKHLFYQYILRFIILIFTAFIAVTIPLLGHLISLLGALCNPLLVLTYPGYMHLCTKYPDDFGKCKWILIKDMFLVIIGILFVITGASTSIMQIVHELSNKQ